MCVSVCVCMYVFNHWSSEYEFLIHYIPTTSSLKAELSISRESYNATQFFNKKNKSLKNVLY